MKNGKTEQTEPEVDFGLRLFGPGAPRSEKLAAFGRLFAENVAPRVASGRPWPAKGVPKSHFLATTLEQISKKSFQEGFQKKFEKWIGKTLKN